MKFTARQIADILNGTVDGNPDTIITGFSKIDDGKPNTLTFLANPQYEQHIYRTTAGIVLVDTHFNPAAPVSATLVRVSGAYAAFATLLNIVAAAKKVREGIDPTASIHPSAKIGAQCYIGHFSTIGENATIGENVKIHPHCYIGDDVTIGDNSIIYPHVTIYDSCIINRSCIIHAGAVIGSDGFGFAAQGETYNKIPQLGNVIIEDNVEIGANTTIDRAVIDSTIIHQGVKIDNLVQIAHNVEIGANTVIAAQTGISGSTKIGGGCRFGGQAGIAGHIRICDNTSVGAQAGVISSITEKQAVMGTPSLPHKSFLRSYVVYSRLPELERTVEQLKKEIEQLKNGE